LILRAASATAIPFLAQRQARAALNPGAAPTINTEFAMLFSFGCMVYDSQNILLTAPNLSLEIARILFI
jgi:hypothetical protein